jgi:hypothetical protein
VVFETRDRSRTVLPSWMLDAGTCVAMTLGPPRATTSSLLDLWHALVALGFDRHAPPVGAKERPDEGPTTSRAGWME